MAPADRSQTGSSLGAAGHANRGLVVAIESAAMNTAVRCYFSVITRAPDTKPPAILACLPAADGRFARSTPLTSHTPQEEGARFRGWLPIAVVVARVSRHR